MKKNSFVEGTLIASVALIFIKIIGALYVVPFYGIVGEMGGALYSYAYTIYALVLDICTAGIPLAISKIISEYNTLEMYEAKERTNKIGNKLIIVISCFLFAITFMFAKEAAYIFIGENTGGNTIEDIELVIRSISFCLLIVPLLAIKKGYLQGHKFISPTATSQVIEQIIRIFVILLGSYLAVNVLKLKVSLGVSIAVFGSFIGGLIAYLYLQIKIKKDGNNIKKPQKGEMDNVSNKTILKKIFRFSIPLMIATMATNIYNITDIALINRGLGMIGYNGSSAETIASIISTWASKICLIVNAIAVGLSTSLVPNLVSSFVKKDNKSLNDYFTKAISIVVIVGLPMSIGISILSEELYTIFYGYSEYGSIILKLLPFSILFSNINLVINSALQSINKFKTIYLNTFVGLIVNALLDIPLILLCNKIGIYPYYGVIIATIIGVIISISISLRSLNKSMNFSYKKLFKICYKSLLVCVLMSLVAISIKIFLSSYFNTRFTMILTCIICAFVSATIYFIISYKFKILNDSFGEDYINKILCKLRLRKM